MMIKIKNFSKLFENSESKKYKNLSWVPIPNKHDGAGYRRIVAMKNSCEIYTAWILMLQIASKSPVRGDLADDDGDFTPEDLSFKTGFPEKIFKDAIIAISDPKIGWIEVSPKMPEDSPKISEDTTAEQNRTEQNRKEKKNTNSVFFKKPTVPEIQNYCKERNNKIDPEQFFDFYESKNWMVGKSKMKNWQASVRTWEKSSFSKSKDSFLNEDIF